MRDPLTNIEIDLRKLPKKNDFDTFFSQGEKEIFNGSSLYSQEKDK